jgi:hypothetical protein
VTFIGKYDKPDPQTAKLKLGQKKDSRPDYKQVVLGLGKVGDERKLMRFLKTPY